MNSRRHLGYLSHSRAARQRKADRGAVDRTRYGTTRISTRKSCFTHHTQQIAKASVMYDARAILTQAGAPRAAITNERQTCLRAGTDGGGASRGMVHGAVRPKSASRLNGLVEGARMGRGFWLREEDRATPVTWSGSRAFGYAPLARVRRRTL